MSCRWGILALALGLVAVAGGAGCPQQIVPGTSAEAGRVLPAGATLADVMHVVNGNSGKIVSLSTSDASISVPLAPTVRASVALERPRRFRLRADAALAGPAADLGSNDELFWFWLPMQSPALYYCHHERFQGSAARQVIPVEPEWLVDAFGIGMLDPNLSHSEPTRLGQGRLEVRSMLRTPEQSYTRITVLDEARGWVLEQHVYDQRGQRLATALTSKHWRDPASGAYVPRQIEIQWPATQFSMRIDVRTWHVNAAAADPMQVWGLPQYAGVQLVDLGAMPPPPAQPPQQAGGLVSPMWRPHTVR